MRVFVLCGSPGVAAAIAVFPGVGIGIAAARRAELNFLVHFNVQAALANNKTRFWCFGAAVEHQERGQSQGQKFSSRGSFMITIKSGITNRYE